MQLKTIQDILPLVEQPSRYLGTEVNSVHKDHSQVKLKFLFAFPDLYEIGTSHFGIQILYNILNKNPDILAERVFTPANDMAAHMKSARLGLPALESGRPAREFDIIGFSLLYELNYTNVLAMLDLAGIAFRAAQRDETHPIIIGGGPCTCNPEPVADFFDALVIGDGENTLPKMTQTWLQWREDDRGNRNELLESWAKITGVYIPSFYTATYEGKGFQILHPKTPDIKNVSRAIVDNLDTAIFPERPIVPFAKPVHDRLRLEVSRGCSRGCRFCQAGMIYRPVRERSMETLLRLTDASLTNTGYEDLSLLSLSTSDYGCIAPLLEHLVDRGASERVAISFPSFRAGTLSAGLMALVKKVRKTGFTIAAEAGSQRLREVINKNIREEDIIQTVQDAFNLGWQVIKLYFMVGLPTETEKDLEAIVDLVKKLHGLPGPKGRKGKITVSVNTFIPKSHTPFQWVPQLSLDESKRRITWLQNQLKMPRVQFKWQKPEVSFLEGLWARGDRRLSVLLETAYRKGCRFDGWSDQFRFDWWLAAMAETEVNPDFYITRERDLVEPLPWDHIDSHIDKDYFRKELEKSLTGEQTPDCRNSECQGCGVCDFNHLEPKVFYPPEEVTPPRTGKHVSKPPQTNYRKLQLVYTKQSDARFFGHLEMVSIFLRAIRRAGIPVKYSEGFHPMPKISFNDPLPLGTASLEEMCYLMVPDYISPHVVREKLNSQLTKGLQIIDVHLALRKKKSTGVHINQYQITLPDGFFMENRLDWFKEQTAVLFSRTNKKGNVKTIDLKESILNIALSAPDRLYMSIRIAPGNNARPKDILSHVFQLSEERVKQALVLKIKTNTE